MKITLRLVVLLIFMSMMNVGCKSNKKEVKTASVSASNTNLNFLDATAAKKAILTDNSDGFFEFLTKADMSIQMKTADIPESRNASLKAYSDLLEHEMMDFSDEEELFMNDVFKSAKSALDKINPNLYPTNIDLIKTDVNHYGPDVYYTRDEAIVLPKNIFQRPSVEDQMPVMLHEIFHILSRYNDDFRDQMYGLIGFKKFDEKLVVPESIVDFVLTNPDGVRRDYVIHLKDKSGKEQRALPLILSKKDRYTKELPTFFSYLNFDLFPLVQTSSNQVTLGVNKDRSSSLGIEHNANFFEQIKDNTTYIIHPDEIMAENFMMAVIANENGNYNGFSEEGKKLLMEVTEILKSFKQ